MRFEEIVVSFARSELPGIVGDDETITISGEPAQARDLLLNALRPSFLFEDEADPVENPPVPHSVGAVYEEYQAAVGLFGQLFEAMFDPGVEARVYAAATVYDEDDDPRLLAPFSVVVLG